VQAVGSLEYHHETDAFLISGISGVEVIKVDQATGNAAPLCQGKEGRTDTARYPTFVSFSVVADCTSLGEFEQVNLVMDPPR